MTLRLNISSTAAEKLERIARSSGNEVESVAAKMLEQMIARSQDEPAAKTNWRSEFDGWVRQQAGRNLVADDSRASIYGGRGE